MKFILNFLTSVFFFPFNLFKILINLNKIINSDVILLQESRNGYGNVYTSLDLFRHIFKNKKKLSISFLETHRFHNTKVFELFNYDSLILKTCFNFKKKVFGEFYKKQNYSYSYKGKNFRNFEEFSSLFQAPKNYFIKYN